MQREVVVRRATGEDAEIVAALLIRLLSELFPDQYAYQADTLGRAARSLLKDGSRYWALLAFTSGGTAVGVVTLNECAAVYALGKFGEIPELYVAPEHRSSGIGAQLVKAAVEFGRERGWSLLEVGAPEVPKWQRTVDFYSRCGFSITGPRMTFDLSAQTND